MNYRMKLNLSAVLLIAGMTAGCSSNLASRVGGAQGDRAWHSRDAFEAKIEVIFGGKKAVDGVFLFDTALGKSRAAMADGTTVVFDGDSAWVSPSDSSMEGARFNILTWPYFIAAPFKLDDPGAHLESLSDGELNGKPHLRAKLTFDASVGDSPDDWYILYVDPDTGWLRALVYIVTFGKPGGSEGAEPHAIVFDDFVNVGGVIVPRKWSFVSYSEEAGIHGEPHGSGTLTNLRFVDPPEDAFVRPEDARVDELPGEAE